MKRTRACITPNEWEYYTLRVLASFRLIFFFCLCLFILMMCDQAIKRQQQQLFIIYALYFYLRWLTTRWNWQKWNINFYRVRCWKAYNKKQFTYNNWWWLFPHNCWERDRNDFAIFAHRCSVGEWWLSQFGPLLHNNTEKKFHKSIDRKISSIVCEYPVPTQQFTCVFTLNAEELFVRLLTEGVAYPIIINW